MARAGNAVIGALRVVLSADTAAFETGLKSARTQLSAFGANVGKTMAVIGAAVAAGLGAAAVAIKGALNEADELGKAAQKFGVPVEELSKLKYAADLSDVSLEALGTGFRMLSRNMAEAMSGTGRAAEAFRALGISVTDNEGNLRASQDVFLDVAAKFAGMEDGARKTALAMDIFGRSGADLIPMLNAGRTGLQDMMREAEALGLVIDQKTARAAESFNDNLTRLRSAFDGLIIQVASALAPALADLTDKMVAYVREGDLAKKIADFIAQSLGELAQMIDYVSPRWAEFTRRMQLAGEVLDAFKRADFDAISAAHQRAAADINKIWADNAKSIAESERKVRASLSDFYKNVIGATQASNEAAKGDRFKPDTQEDIDAVNDALQRQEELTRTTAQAWDDLRLAGKRVFDETRTPAEKLQYRMAELNQLLQQGAIDWETYRRAVNMAQDQFDKAAQQVDKSWQKIGRTIDDTVNNAISGLIDGTLEWKDLLRDALKSLAAAILNMNTLSGAGAGTGGGIGGLIVGGFQNLLGFADGGMGKVRGYGGVDSQIVSLRATPGELVEVHKNGQDMSGLNAEPSRVLVELSPDLIARQDAKTRAMGQVVLVQARKAAKSDFAGNLTDAQLRKL